MSKLLQWVNKLIITWNKSFHHNKVTFDNSPKNVHTSTYTRTSFIVLKNVTQKFVLKTSHKGQYRVLIFFVPQGQVLGPKYVTQGKL
jgi:hypothetical protein